MNKKMYTGRVKKRIDFKEGRSSLLVFVDGEDGERIIPKHVNLAINTDYVKLENIDYASVIAFEACGFHQWRIGEDRFIGEKQSNDKDNPKYYFPKLSQEPHRFFGSLKEWANTDYLAHYGINGDLFLAKGITPINCLIGFNPESVALHEGFKIDPTQKVSQIASKAFEHAKRAAEQIENLEPNVLI
jgi:hypothetical protein